MDLAAAKTIADTYVERLAPYCGLLEIAGSIRRKRPQVGDIEIVCIPREIEVPDLFSENRPVRVPGFAKVLAGLEIIKGKPATGKNIQCNTPEGIKLDIFTATTDNLGFIFAIRTGSAEFSQYLGAHWVRRGFRGIGGHMTRGGEIFSTPTEKGFFQMLGVPWVEPQERNQMGMPDIVNMEVSDEIL